MMIDASVSKLMNNQKIPLTHEQKQIIRDYASLAALEKCSEEQSQKMMTILKIAQSDKVIDFLITEVDHFIGHKLNLIDDNECKNYQASLAEHLLLNESNPDIVLS